MHYELLWMVLSVILYDTYDAISDLDFSLPPCRKFAWIWISETWVFIFWPNSDLDCTWCRISVAIPVADVGLKLNFGNEFGFQNIKIQNIPWSTSKFHSDTDSVSYIRSFTFLNHLKNQSRWYARRSRYDTILKDLNRALRPESLARASVIPTCLISYHYLFGLWCGPII